MLVKIKLILNCFDEYLYQINFDVRIDLFIYRLNTGETL